MQTQSLREESPIEYEGTRPEEILARIVSEHGKDVTLSRPETRRKGGIFGFFAKEVQVVKVTERPGSRRVDPVARFLDDTEDEVVLGGVDHSPYHPSSSDADEERVGQHEQAPTPAMDFQQLLDSAAAAMGRHPQAMPLPSLEAVADAEEEPDRRWEAVRELLRSAGLPAGMIPAQPPPSGGSWIEAIFGPVPAPPPLPTVAGGLVAVVGPAEGGRAPARSLRKAALPIASRIGCPDDEVAVVARGAVDRQVPEGYFATSPDIAASFAPGWRRIHAGVVVVAGGGMGYDQEFARAALKALKPSTVIAVVSAGAKPEDVNRFVTDIGGADALMLMEADRTCSPAAVLSLGIPVAYIGPKDATASEWAALLAEHVASRW